MTEDNYKHSEFHSILRILESDEGAGHDLLSLYIPPDKPISEVTGYLKDMYTRSETILGNRTELRQTLSFALSDLKKYENTPKNGLALFCRADSGMTGADHRCTILEPPEPVPSYLYRHSTKFELEPLKHMLGAKDVYGLLVIDLSGARWGFLRGDRVVPAGKSSSNIPGKQRKGGQSSARFQRLREIAVGEFFSRVGNHASETFLGEKDFFSKFRGVLVGGPGITKEDFVRGHFLHHEVQKRVIGLFNVTETGEKSLADLGEQAHEAILGENIASQKDLLAQFRLEHAKSDGLTASGEESIRKNLAAGAVGTLLLSAGLRRSHRRITCRKCGHSDQRTIQLEPETKVQDILARTCRICSDPIIGDEEVDIIEDLTHLADQGDTTTKIISENFREGLQFHTETGGIAAILRYRTGF